MSLPRRGAAGRAAQVDRTVWDWVRPKAEELRWTEIPWRTDLWEGCREAAEVGRPVFLWAMNGNPLGCV
jgi:hypothetical protein